MRKFLVIIVGMTAFCGVHAQMTSATSNATGNGTVHFLYYIPNRAPSAAGYPLIISLAGVGEEGDGSPGDLQNLYVGGVPKKIHDGVDMIFSYTNTTPTGSTTTTDGFVVMAPQLPKLADWQNYFVDEMLDYASKHFNIDPNRIFLTGYSLGGIGTWRYAFTSPNINKFAGIVPISSNSTLTNCNLSGTRVAVWAFQGGSDGTFGGTAEHDIVTTINNCSNISVPAIDTIYASYTHGTDFWDNVVYSPTNNRQYPNIYQWMLKVNRGLVPATNAAPVPVIAGGPVINLTAPVRDKDFPVLSATTSHDDDDLIIDYLWEQTGGTTVSLANRQWPVATVASSSTIGHTVGTYNFRLRVKDYLTSVAGHTAFAPLTVNISLPSGTTHTAPAVLAGGPINLAIGQVPPGISGYAMTYGNSNIQSYNWRFIDGPQAAGITNFDGSPYAPNSGNNIRVTNTDKGGTYRFEFSTANNFGEVGRDTLIVNRAGALLPVSYSYLNGRNTGSSNVISWATTSEINSERFDIQRSTDGVNFVVIGSVQSKGGSVETAYSFEDAKAPTGNSYYRLSQVDKDGHSALSQTIAITNSARIGLFVEKYPNPVHDNLTVTMQGTVNGPLKMIVADMQGKVLLQQNWQKDLSQLKKVINVASLQNGVYQVIITIGQEKKVSSFVKY